MYNKIKQFASPVYGDGISKRFIEIFPDFDNDSPNSLTRVRDPFN